MKEYIQSIVRHIMTIASGVIVVSEGETIESALQAFIGNIGNGDPASLFSAGMILAVLIWSALEKVKHKKEIKTLKKGNV